MGLQKHLLFTLCFIFYSESVLKSLAYGFCLLHTIWWWATNFLRVLTHLTSAYQPKNVKTNSPDISLAIKLSRVNCVHSQNLPTIFPLICYHSRSLWKSQVPSKKYKIDYGFNHVKLSVVIYSSCCGKWLWVLFIMLWV